MVMAGRDLGVESLNKLVPNSFLTLDAFTQRMRPKRGCAKSEKRQLGKNEWFTFMRSKVAGMLYKVTRKWAANVLTLCASVAEYAFNDRAAGGMSRICLRFSFSRIL